MKAMVLQKALCVAFATAVIAIGVPLSLVAEAETPTKEPASEITPSQETTLAPEITPVPEITLTPETTLTPEITPTPETTLLPGTTIVPEITPISKAVITAVNWDEAYEWTKTYTGTAFAAPTATLTVEGEGDIEIPVLVDEILNAGIYTATINVDEEMYDASGVVLTKKITVNAVTVEINPNTEVADYSKPYVYTNHTAHNISPVVAVDLTKFITATVNNGYRDESLPVNGTYDIKKAASYPVTVAVAEGYDVNSIRLINNLPSLYQIQKSTVQVTYSTNIDGVYDGSKTLADLKPALDFTKAPDLSEEEVIVKMNNMEFPEMADDIVLTPGEYTVSVEFTDREKQEDSDYTISSASQNYKIDYMQLAVEEDQIDSRTSSFSIKTNIIKDNTTIAINLDFNGIEKETGIAYSTNTSDYVRDVTDYTGECKEISLFKVDYSKNKETWKGYLPAGTVVEVSAVCNDAAGNLTPVTQNAIALKVEKAACEIGIVPNMNTKPSDGGYFYNPKRQIGQPTFTGAATAIGNEIVDITCDNTHQTYTVLNYSFTPFKTPDYVTQIWKASILDTLNLTCDTKEISCVYDDEAQPVKKVIFENRERKGITIELGEIGQIENVDIAGATIKPGGSWGTSEHMAVEWEAPNLIKSGSDINVSYKDEAGNRIQKQLCGTVSKSTVDSAINFSIRPGTNAAGYLNGECETLIVTGVACGCEPIRVTMNGQTQEVYASGSTWANGVNGSWKTSFSMKGLPEKQDFTISAEYVDVNGGSYSMTAKYDEFVSKPVILSPVFEAMSSFSGMAEKDCSIRMIINGDTGNTVDIKKDAFGHFTVEDLPLMLAGDYFEIQVIDIAGNMNATKCVIPENEDAGISTGISALGKYKLIEDKETPSVGIATPVSVEDFTNAETVEIPLLLGDVYKVGKLVLTKTASGFTVDHEFLCSSADCTSGKPKLYVYSVEPSVDQLQNHSGQEYQYGTEIALAGDVVWIVSEQNVVISEEYITDLDVFGFKTDAYVKYQNL